MTRNYANGDKIKQAENKLAGLCKECGNKPAHSTKHQGYCMPCFWDFKRHYVGVK